MVNLFRIFGFAGENYFSEWKMKVIGMLVKEIQDIYKIDQVLLL
jgi:hypothetical protein